ncbi:MAG TPA: LysR family transcriptional regulator [Kiloniellaceae bacterium]|nr:LysR family transcriptional regulator [Kiloniellaceae bacterium]
MLSDKPAGHLVAHVPVSFGRLHLAPIIHEFTAAHPYLTVEIVLSDDYADFSDSLIDVAIRIGRLSQGSLIARKLCDNVRQLCAAPSYVETFGAPEHPRDLADHACLEFTPLRTAGTWQFVSGDEEQTVVKPRSVLKSNNAELLLAAALNGVGIGIPAHFLAAAHLRSGALVPLLPDWKIVSSAIYVVYPDRSQLPPKTRSFVDFVVDRFSGTLPWDRD